MAIFDTGGELLRLISRRNARMSEIISEIIHHGHPLIIGSDVKKVPDRIRSIARNTDAKLYCPDRVITELEKTALCSGYRYRNTHERDALASGIKAYRKYENVLRKLSSRGVEPRFIREVFKGKSLARVRKENE